MARDSPQMEVLSVLKVKDLTVHYGYIQALNGITFSVPEGKVISLIGANGAGKTTALMAISGMVPKRGGTVDFDGADITALKPHMITRRSLAHVPEGRRVFPKLSVEDNIISGSLIDKKLTKAELKSRMEEMYDLFPRLKERRLQDAGTLSGGEQQMLAIARGLIGKPKLVMLDEPSLGLAPIVVDEIFELISKIRENGTTVLLIEQNAGLALQIADYAYVLELGRITLEGPGVELLKNSDVKRAYLGI